MCICHASSVLPLSFTRFFGCFPHKNSLCCQQWIQLYLPPECDKLNTEISFCLSTLSDSMFYCHKSWWFMWNIVALPIDDGRCNARLARGLAYGIDPLPIPFLACRFACCVVSELSWCLARCLAHCFALMKMKMKMKMKKISKAKTFSDFLSWVEWLCLSIFAWGAKRKFMRWEINGVGVNFDMQELRFGNLEPHIL